MVIGTRSEGAWAQAMMRAVNAAVIGQAIWGVTRTLHPDRERYRRGEAFGCQKEIPANFWNLKLLFLTLVREPFWACRFNGHGQHG
jgi:hypothetical protein